MTPLSETEAATVARFEAAEPAPESWDGGRTASEYVARARQRMLDAGEDPDRPVFAAAADARPVGDGDGQDGLREALARAIYASDLVGDDWNDARLPADELAALRAKAAAADRVRELAARWADSDPDDANDDYGAGWDAAERQCAFDLLRALDGPPC